MNNNHCHEVPTRHEVGAERLAILDQQIDALRAKLASRNAGEHDPASAALELTLATLLQSRSVYERTLDEFERARTGRPADEDRSQAATRVRPRVDGRIEVLRRIARLDARADIDPQARLLAFLDASLELAGAGRALLQLRHEPTGGLRIAAQRGFAEPFLSVFDVLESTGDAARHLDSRAASLVVVADTRDPALADDAARQVLVDAGVAAAIFVPLLDLDGRLLGILSTHFAQPHVPDGETLSLLELLAPLAARAVAASRSRDTQEGAARELAQTFENAAVGLARCTRDLRVAAANVAYARLTGLPREGIVGRRIDELFDGARLEAIRPYMERVLRGAWVEYEIEVEPPSEAPRWLHVTHVPWKDGPEVVGWLATVTDVTARRHAERALAAATRRSDNLLDMLTSARRELDDLKRHLAEEVLELETLYLTAQAGLTSFDRALRCTRISQRMAEINGVPVDASLGRHLREYIPQPLADQAEPLLRKVIETGAPIVGVEVRGQTQAGVPRHWRVNYSPVRAADGAVVGVTVAVIDVTD